MKNHTEKNKADAEAKDSCVTTKEQRQATITNNSFVIANAEEQRKAEAEVKPVKLPDVI